METGPIENCGLEAGKDLHPADLNIFPPEKNFILQMIQIPNYGRTWLFDLMIVLER
jgi:hypothetical protein